MINLDSFANELVKIAGSMISFYPGEKPDYDDYKNSYSPSVKYHYSTQGKYGYPGLIENIKGIKWKDKEGPWGYYVGPNIAKEYIKAYSKSKGKAVYDNPDSESVKYVKSKEYNDEHKAVIKYLNKHKNTGFTVNVG